jgi:heat shock protein HslJ
MTGMTEMRALLVLFVALTLAACANDRSRAPTEGSKMKTVTAQDLAGTEWLLESLGGASVLERAPATLAFPEPGRVAGKGSCNRFMGSVEIGQGAVRFGKMASTMMACPPEVMQQEAAYLKALENADRISFEGRYLLVYAKGLEKPLRFTRMDSVKPAS